MSTNDRRGDLSRAYEQAVTVVSGAKAEQLASPTPCPGFDVAALVDHLVGVGWRAAALGRGEAPTHDEFPHIELANAAEELRRSSKEAAAAWSDNARLAGTVIMPWGEAYVGTTLVNMYLAELSAHSWTSPWPRARWRRSTPPWPPPHSTVPGSSSTPTPAT